MNTHDPAWSGGNNHGHGTNTAGTALYGDLVSPLETTGAVLLTHRLESVKVLQIRDENEPGLYGAITEQSVDRAENPRTRASPGGLPRRYQRSDIGTDRGRPSSRSGAIDQLCFGDEIRR